MKDQMTQILAQKKGCVSFIHRVTDLSEDEETYTIFFANMKLVTLSKEEFEEICEIFKIYFKGEGK